MQRHALGAINIEREWMRGADQAEESGIREEPGSIREPGKTRRAREVT